MRQALVSAALIARSFVILFAGIQISPEAEIGPGLVVHTLHGVFVGPIKIGRNCVVQSGVSIANVVKRVGDNVYFGPGAKAMGKLTIGSNVVVVANSLVMTDVPDNTTVIGVPARIRWPRGRTLRFSQPSNDGGESEPAADGNSRTTHKEER